MPHQEGNPAVVNLGNVWLIAATLAQATLSEAHMALGEPLAITVDQKGDLRAIGPEHPDYDAALLGPGWVCTASWNSDPVRLAGRIRDAVLAHCAAGGSSG